MPVSNAPREKVPKVEPANRIANFEEVSLGYTREQAIEAAKRCMACKKPTCLDKCPTRTAIPKFVKLISEGKFHEALTEIYEKRPLVAVTGRVCPHPCEAACIRAKKGEAVSINALERAAADFGGGPDLPMPTPTGKKVAIVGSGPGGLTVAWFMALHGHTVDIFEQLPVIGGMLAVGIPRYRLPQRIIDKEIDVLRRLGVSFKTNVKVGRDVALDHLLKDYAAVYLGTGAMVSVKLDVPGENLQGLVHGLNYLIDFALGRNPKLGDKVAVIGGGNTAIDVVRTAVRTGSKKVFIVYRRSRAEMPADPEEIADAEEEGVTVHYLAAPVEILGKDGKVVGMKCIKMQLGEPDRSGRPRPVPIPGSEFVIELDNVIPAVSQSVDASFVPQALGLRLSKWGSIEANPETGETNVPGLFAGGDCVRGPSIVGNAIRDATKAAECMQTYITEKC